MGVSRHVALDIRDGGVLIVGFLRIQGIFKFALQWPSGVKRIPALFCATRKARGVDRPCLRAICGRGLASSPRSAASLSSGGFGAFNIR